MTSLCSSRSHELSGWYLRLDMHTYILNYKQRVCAFGHDLCSPFFLQLLSDHVLLCYFGLKCLLPPGRFTDWGAGVQTDNTSYSVFCLVHMKKTIKCVHNSVIWVFLWMMAFSAGVCVLPVFKRLLRGSLSHVPSDKMHLLHRVASLPVDIIASVRKMKCIFSLWRYGRTLGLNISEENEEKYFFKSILRLKCKYWVVWKDHAESSLKKTDLFQI